MGYYTNFTLEKVTGPGAEDFFRDFHEDRIVISENSSLSHVLDSSAIKWYDWKQDLTSVSARYPDTMIVVSGHGEDFDDIWIAYCMNGHVEKIDAEITYPEPNMQAFPKGDKLREQLLDELLEGTPW